MLLSFGWCYCSHLWSGHSFHFGSILFKDPLYGCMVHMFMWCQWFHSSHFYSKSIVGIAKFSARLLFLTANIISLLCWLTQSWKRSIETIQCSPGAWAIFVLQFAGMTKSCCTYPWSQLWLMACRKAHTPGDSSSLFRKVRLLALSYWVAGASFCPLTQPPVRKIRPRFTRASNALLCSTSPSNLN